MNAAQVASRQIRRIKYDVPEKPRSEPGSPRGEAEIIRKFQLRLEEIAAVTSEFDWLVCMIARWFDDAATDLSSGSMNIIHCGSERMSCAGEVFLAILRRAGDTGVVAIEAPCEAAP